MLSSCSANLQTEQEETLESAHWHDDKQLARELAPVVPFVKRWPAVDVVDAGVYVALLKFNKKKKRRS